MFLLRNNENYLRFIFKIQPYLKLSLYCDHSLESQVHVKGQIPCFCSYKTKFYSFQNNPKNLDPSCKMDRDFSDCSRKVKLVL